MLWRDLDFWKFAVGSNVYAISTKPSSLQTLPIQVPLSSKLYWLWKEGICWGAVQPSPAVHAHSCAVSIITGCSASSTSIMVRAVPLLWRIGDQGAAVEHWKYWLLALLVASRLSKRIWHPMCSLMLVSWTKKNPFIWMVHFSLKGNGLTIISLKRRYHSAMPFGDAKAKIKRLFWPTDPMFKSLAKLLPKNTESLKVKIYIPFPPAI
jgi:hypothetical protein